MGVGNTRGFPARRPRSAESIERVALTSRSRLCPSLRAWDPFEGLRLYERIHTFPLRFKGREMRLETRVRELPGSVEAYTKFDAENEEFTLHLSEATYHALRCEEPRARFTFAHELGHLCMHLEELVTLRALPAMDRVMARATSNHPPYLDVEWQANTFAARILVPDAGLALLTNELGELTAHLVAERFAVSNAVATARLSQFIARRAA